MKRVLALCLILICLVTLALPAGARGYTAAVEADAALLYNRSEDRVLYAKNASGQLAPGKAAQLMTALLAAERISDHEKSVTIKLPYPTGSSLPSPLTEGSVVSLQDLLTMVLLTGSDDAALALAMAVYPDTTSFVDEMNQRASDLGMTNTTYTNPTGAYDKKQLTTVNDLFTLAKAVWNNELLAQLLTLSEARVGPSGMSIQNGNRMLAGAASADTAASVTAGFAGTPANGSDACLAVLAQADDGELLCLLLGGSDMEAMIGSTEDLLAYGSGSTTDYNLKELLGDIPLSYSGSNGSYYTVTADFPEDEILTLSSSLNPEEISVRLLKEENSSGTAVYYDGEGKELARIPVTFTRIPSESELSGRRVLLVVIGLLTLFLCLVLIFALQRFYYTYEFQKRQRLSLRREGAPAVPGSGRYVRRAFYRHFPVWVLWATALLLLIVLALCFNLYNR